MGLDACQTIYNFHLFCFYTQRRSVQPSANQELMLLKYHIIGCATIPTNNNAADSANFTTLLGPVILVKTEVSVSWLSPNTSLNSHYFCYKKYMETSEEKYVDIIA